MGIDFDFPESRKILFYRSTLAKEFPMVGAEEGSQAMIEEDAGLVYADKCVKMLQVKPKFIKWISTFPNFNK